MMKSNKRTAPPPEKLAKTPKRLLSGLLAMVMVLGMVAVGGVVGSHATLTVTPNTVPTATFKVPETIWLDAAGATSNSSTTSTIDKFCNIDGTGASDNAQVVFSCAGASLESVVCDSISGGGNFGCTVGSDSTTGSWAGHGQSVSGLYGSQDTGFATWTATYTYNSERYTAEAYSVIWGPSLEVGHVGGHANTGTAAYSGGIAAAIGLTTSGLGGAGLNSAFYTNWTNRSVPSYTNQYPYQKYGATNNASDINGIEKGKLGDLTVDKRFEDADIPGFWYAFEVTNLESNRNPATGDIASRYAWAVSNTSGTVVTGYAARGLQGSRSDVPTVLPVESGENRFYLSFTVYAVGSGVSGTANFDKDGNYIAVTWVDKSALRTQVKNASTRVPDECGLYEAGELAQFYVNLKAAVAVLGHPYATQAQVDAAAAQIYGSGTATAHHYNWSDSSQTITPDESEPYNLGDSILSEANNTGAYTNYVFYLMSSDRVGTPGSWLPQTSATVDAAILPSYIWSFCYLPLYNIQYDSGAGGLGSMASTKHMFYSWQGGAPAAPGGCASELAANEFIWTGNHFIGWSYANDNTPSFTTQEDFDLGKHADFTAQGPIGVPHNGIVGGSTVTIYACWAAGDPVTIEYHANYIPAPSPSEVTDPVTYPSGGTFTAFASTTFTQTGYSFQGWATDPGGPVDYTGGQTGCAFPGGTQDGDTVDLYAIWTPEVYKDEDGRSIELRIGYTEDTVDEEDVVATLTEATFGEPVADGIGYNAPAARAGYTLAGWAKTAGATTGVSENVPAFDDAEIPFVLYAIWTPIGTGTPRANVTVIFDYEPTSLTPPVPVNKQGGADSKLVKFGETYGALPEPTREGYSFDGWFKEAAFTNKVSAESIVNNENTHTLYAKWYKGMTVEPTEDPNGDPLTDKDGNPVPPGGGELDITEGLPVLKDPNGWHFIGWYKDGKPVTAEDLKDGGSATPMFARKYIVKFVASFEGEEGGYILIELSEDTMRVVWYSGEFQEGLTLDGDLTVFPGAAREGYTFEGWYTEDGILVDGPDKVWQLVAGNPLYLMPDPVPDELEIPRPQAIDDGSPDLVLYARWKTAEAPGVLGGKIERCNVWWRRVLHIITFGIFWKNFQRVTITPDAPGVAVEYFIGEKCMTQAQLESVVWKPYSAPFRIHHSLFSHHRVTVYARLTDGAGNAVILSK